MSEDLTNANKLFLAKQFEDAIILYNKILEKNPHNLDVINNKGYALGKLKKHAEAIQCYDFGLSIYPNEKTLLVNKISSLRKLKAYQDSLNICEQILKSHPDDNITLYHKERILFSMEKYPESIQCCDVILASYPKNAEVLFDKAASLAKINHTQTIPTLIQAIAADHHLKVKAKNHKVFANYSTNQEFLRVVSWDFSNFSVISFDICAMS